MELIYFSDSIKTNNSMYVIQMCSSKIPFGIVASYVFSVNVGMIT